MTKLTLFRVLTLSLFVFNSSAWALAETLSSEKSKAQASFATKLWADTCLHHMSNYQTLSFWARANNLDRVKSDVSDSVLQNKAGEVWSTSNKHGDFWLVLTQPNTCAVWTSRADALYGNEIFQTMMQSLEKNSAVAVKLEKDITIKGSDGKYRQVAYFTQDKDQPYGWVFISTTSASESAMMQMRLTMSPATR